MRHPWIRAVSTLGLGACLMAGCGGRNIEGTYEAGIYKLEIMADGKAKMSIAGEGPECTYTRPDSRKIALNCPGGNPMELTIDDDGSLQAAMIGQMKRTK